MSDHQGEYDDGGERPADRPRPRHNGRGPGYGAGAGAGAGYGGQAPPHADLPLRILVSSEMVGAIIGRQGNTIRQITQNTRARVDVHRKDSNGATEKAITIFGNPENCDNACREILDVMNEEAANTNKGEVPLKILAHNNLIGRIIGKGGNVIKGIMEETDTRITVSRASEVSSYNMDRTITIRGAPEGVAEAERRVMARLRQSYENDLHSAAPHAALYSDVGRMMGHPAAGYGGRGDSGLYGPGPAGFGPMYPGLSGQPETVFVYVPSASVGAIIGRKGSHIRNMIRCSGASVKIGQEEEEPAAAARPPPPPREAEQAEQEAEEGSEDTAEAGEAGEAAERDAPRPERPPERKVAIYGTPEAQYKAQYMIFDKLREEGYGPAGPDDVRLSVEITVPSSQVGRIIGKKGQNVRELQRTTGTVIKLPQPPEDGGEPPAETAVLIVGAFVSVWSAQRRVRALAAQGAPAGRPGGAARAPPADAPPPEL